jgi:hypothetical protein
MKRTPMALVLTASVLVCALAAAGCGAIGNTPEATARKVLDLVKSGKMAEAREYFATPASATVVRNAFGDEGTARVGKVTLKDPLSAVIDVYIGQSAQSPNLVFTMVKSNGQWKIMQVFFQ